MRAALPVSLDDIRAAATASRPGADERRWCSCGASPRSAACRSISSWNSQQRTGSFKLRGATNALLSLSADERARGVVAASTGNHGRALAYAARAVGRRATICMSRLVPQNKVEAIRRLGAEVRIVGSRRTRRSARSTGWSPSEGLAMLPPFDHRRRDRRPGHLGLEMMQAVPALRRPCWCRCSGGGLAAGIAAAVKALRPATRVIGVTMERGAAMKASLAAGRPVEVEECRAGGFARRRHRPATTASPLPCAATLLDDVLLLSEAEIAAGMRHAYAGGARGGRRRRRGRHRGAARRHG